MSQPISPFPSFPMTSQVEPNRHYLRRPWSSAEAYIFPLISISDYEHEHEHGSFTRALSFLRHLSFVLRHFTFLTHHFSSVTFFFLFAPCLTKAYLLITLLPFL